MTTENKSDKQSFILYKDIKPLIDMMSNEQAGLLFKSIYDYVCDKKDPNCDDVIVNNTFNFIKIKIDDASKKYEAKCKKNKENIAKRWAKKNTTKDIQEDTNVSNGNTNEYQSLPTDTGTDTELSKDNNKKDTKVSKKVLSFDYIDNYDDLFIYWNDNKKGGKYKNKQSYDIAFNKLKSLTDNDFDFAKEVIENSIINNYQGFVRGGELFITKSKSSSKPSKSTNVSKEDIDARFNKLRAKRANNG